MFDALNYSQDGDAIMELTQVVEKTYLGFEKLIDKTGKYNNFLSCISQIKLKDTSSEDYSNLFCNAVNESLLNKEVDLRNIKQLSVSKLTSVGLIRFSLKIKIQLLKEKLSAVNSLINHFADFKNKNVTKAFLEELDVLVNIFDSLKAIVPSLEPLVELIKVLMSLIRQL
jgi:hypothetical protein